MKKSDTDLHLFNTVVQYDIYIVAHTKEEAEEAVLGAIQQGEKPMEMVTIPINSNRDIRSEWREERPLVANAVTDTEWKPFTGKSTYDFFEAISLPKVKK